VGGGTPEELAGSAPASDRDPAALNVTTELVQGVRGAFEFEFDPGIESGGFEKQAGWVLWWRQIYPAVVQPGDMDPVPGQRVGQTRLMGNIAAASWNVLYTKRTSAGQGSEGERLREHAAVWADDLPGYIELDVLSNTGARHQWTFEVGWGVSGEPGSVVSVTAPGTQPGATSAAPGLGTGAGAGAAADRARTPTATDTGATGTGRRSGSGSGSGSGRSGASTGGSRGNGEPRR